MALVAGKVMLRPRGPYDSTASYDIIDAVTHNNKLWIAKKPGLCGVEPTKTDENWMLAIDGTTDVKALEAEIYAKFDVINSNFDTANANIADNASKISSINAWQTTTNSNVQDLKNRCSTLEGKVNIDDKARPQSTKLITSGSAYELTNSSYFTGNATNYEDYNSKFLPSNYSAYIQSTHEQYTSGGLHRIMTGSISVSGMETSLHSQYEMCSDNADSSFKDQESAIDLSGASIGFTIQAGSYGDSGYKRTRLWMNATRFYPQTDAGFDLGNSGNRFRDIYSSNGTIQTSDAAEKKEIADLDSDLTRDLIMGLRPVSFKFINGTSGRTHYGLIAQEVEKLVNDLGISNKDFAPLIKSQKEDEEGNVIEGEYVYGLRYSEFIGSLVKMCQNLQNEVDELKAEVAALKA